MTDETHEYEESQTVGQSDLSALLRDAVWTGISYCDGVDTLYTTYLDDGGRITVLDRMTGYGDRDIESGYKDINSKFWLASGNCDVRLNDNFTVGDAVEWIKKNANTCIHT